MIVLSGDIGGTNTRLQLTKFNQHKKNTHEVLKQEQHQNLQFRNLTEIVRVFLANADVDSSKIHSVCFAVAGPIVNNVVKFTNLPWVVDATEIKHSFGINKVALINDFQGIGYGIEMLHKDDLFVLQEGIPKPRATKALIGAGTGLGVGIVNHFDDQYYVCATEGGHVDFAPVDDVQIDLLLYMRKKYHRISNERLVSGQGLVNIYQFVRDNNLFSERENSELRLALHSGADVAAIIAEYATVHRDIMAMRALEIFVRIYGAAAGNLALTTLPFSGLYIAGGIAPKIIPQLADGHFMAAFLDKGRMSGLLKDIPIYVVKNTNIGLDGAALYASRM